MSGNTSASGGILTPVAPDLTDDQLVDIFTELVSGITSLPGELVRPKWQPKPAKRPANTVNWAALGITETTADAGPVLKHDGAGNGGLGQDTYYRQRDVAVFLSFYGPNAKATAQLLEDGIAVPQNVEDVQANYSISFVSAGTIRAVPESVNMQWVTRYDIQLFFRRAVGRTYAIQNLDSADVTSTIEDITSTVHIVP